MLAWVLAAQIASAAGFPNPALTPGIADAAVTGQIVCGTRWGRSSRHVTAAMRRQVYRAYGLTGAKDPACGPKGCTLDHLISRELGGADDVANLWPQPNSGLWTAKTKDRLENRLRREVCSGRLSITEAQESERRDWIAAYKSYFRDR